MMPNLPLSAIPAGKRSSAAREALSRRRVVATAKNKGRSCSVSGCDKGRYNLSCYCLGHYRRYRKYGRAVGRLPTQGELRAIEGALRDWLEQDYLSSNQAKRSFKLNWGSAQQTITHNPSFALPFFRLEGDMGYTQKAKAWVILSNYVHRQQNPLSDAMLRYMACRLWAEFHWQMPNGKRGVTKERDFFVHTWAGYFVLRNSGFSKEKTEQKIIGWERPWCISDNPSANQSIPITERVTTKVTLSAFKAGPIVRAIGKEVHAAVDHAMGNTWFSDHRLLEKTYEALGLPSNIISTRKDNK